jgi:superfamily I DNA/RNA helicase
MQILGDCSFFESAKALGAIDRARAFDLIAKIQANPGQPGLNLERVKSGGPGIHSVRISGGVRAILHVDGERYVFLYAGPHEDAYEWARGRRFEPHPVTGEFQIVRSAETTETVHSSREAAAEAPSGPRLLPAGRFADDYLLSLGVPPDWLPVIRHLSDEEQLLEVSYKLPQEVGDRLFALANGEIVTPPSPVPTAVSGKPRPLTLDEQRHLFVVGDLELADILEKPLDAWMRFLHPTQRALAAGSFSGPVKVIGSAGTGKTVVGMHRVRHLAAQGKRVLMTSYVTTLCRNLERNLKVLLRPEEFERVTVSTVHAQALAVLGRIGERVQPVGDEELQGFVKMARRRAASDLDAGLLESEWRAVVEGQGLCTWDEYRDAERRGRGRPLSVRDRKKVWTFVEKLRDGLADGGRDTFPGLCRRALQALADGRASSPFDAIVVDEVQDLRPVEIRFLAALASRPGNAPDLMLLGDAGQRIYPGGFSLRALGIDVRGRSRVLRINYRTTDQIRRTADRILDGVTDDLDEGSDRRSGTRSLLRGPTPVLQGFPTAKDEAAWIVAQIEELRARGLAAGDLAVFARAGASLDTLRKQLTAADVPWRDLSQDRDASGNAMSLGTMHRAKGLEFKVVFVAECSQSQLPAASARRATADPADRAAALARERSLLYVSLTRARDEAFVTWTGEPSPFLAPIMAGTSRSQQGAEERA